MLYCFWVTKLQFSEQNTKFLHLFFYTKIVLTYNLTVLHLQFCDFEEKKHAITLYYIYNIYIIYIVYKYTHFMLE